MMDPGHFEHNLWGVVSLAMPDIPEAWQHALNHWLDAALAFSGLAPVLGYGVLVLALPLLLLPIAFPELSRPRDAPWSLLLAALAPLLLLNRLPVLSSAGFGELIATVLMVRLAAEVGQGRWASLTPDQRWALRHLPRWRRAGADVVAAVVQAAKDTWRATAQAGKTAWVAMSGQPATGASPGPVVDNVPDAEPPQPVAGDDGGQGTEGAEGNLKDGATAGSGEAAPEEEQRAGTGLVAAVIQAARNTWRAVSGQKSPVEQRRQGQSAQKPARKEWVRPDPPDGAQGGQDQDGETRSETLDVAPATVTSPGPAADAADNVPDVEPPQPVDGGAGDQGTEGAEVSMKDVTPEEHSAPEPEEEAQQTQPVDVDDPGDTQGAATGPCPLVPEVVESPVEPAVQPSEGSANDVVSEPEPRESVSEEPRTPEPAEAAEEPSAPEPEEEAQQTQPVDVDDPGDTQGAATGPCPLVPEVVESPVEPAVQPSEGSANNVVSEPEPRENVSEEPRTPEPAEAAEEPSAPEPEEEAQQTTC